jgi:hypothetical protein
VENGSIHEIGVKASIGTNGIKDAPHFNKECALAKKQSAPKTERHHYIPQFYLRPWRNLQTDKQLEEYGRIVHSGQISSRRVFTKETGHEPNLYTMPGVTEETKQNAEKLFYHKVDTAAAIVRDKLLAGVPLTGLDEEHWARFVLSLATRNPDDIAAAKAITAKILKEPDQKTEEVYAKMKKEGYPETASELLAMAFPHASEIAAINSTVKNNQNRKLLNLIKSMEWKVIDVSPAKRRLLTSDRPLMMSNGLLRPDGYIWLPISPTKLFTAATLHFFGEQVAKEPLSRTIRDVNSTQIGQARKYVYGCDASEIANVRKGMSKMMPPTLMRMSGKN